MIDREKVIKAIENNLAENYEQRGCETCPYNDDCHGCATAWKADALALLKEQPKMVVVQDDGCPCCPTCGNELYAFPHHQKYCDECGQAVKWDENT